MVLLVATLLLGQTMSIPIGGYILEDLCSRLTEKTGVKHSLQPELVDYSVFLSVKAASPSRIERLVATAFDSEWKAGAGGLILTKSKFKNDVDFADFSREATAVLAAGKLAHLPVQDLYDLAPGAILRYGSEPNDLINPLPAGFGDGSKPTRIKVRRQAFGDFEVSYQGADGTFGPFDPEGSITFRTLPASVLGLIKDDANKPVAGSGVPSQLAGASSRTQDPLLPILSDQLKRSASLVSADIVVALDDQTLAVIFNNSEGQQATVSGRLGRFSTSNVWMVSDGAAIARLPVLELDHPTQVKRNVLTDLVKAVGEQGVVTFKSLSDYIRQQRPESSDTWCDAILLAMNKLVIDEEYIGDYPFNERLAASLSDDDWKLMNGNKRFPASALSPAAADALRPLLLQSGSRMEGRDPVGQNQGDPALWPTIAPQNLRITPDEKKETVLIGIGPGGIADVRTLPDLANIYESRRREQGKEPMFLLAERTNLKITIGDAAGNSVKTGFTEVRVAKGAQWCVWSSLPGNLPAQFKKALAETPVGRPLNPPPVEKP